MQQGTCSLGHLCNPLPKAKACTQADDNSKQAQRQGDADDEAVEALYAKGCTSTSAGLRAHLNVAKPCMASFGTLVMHIQMQHDAALLHQGRLQCIIQDK